MIVFSFAAIHSRKATVVNRVICWLASYTFSIYLLHPVVNSFLDMYEVRSCLSEALLKFHIGGGRKRNPLYDMHYFYSSEYLSGN